MLNSQDFQLRVKKGTFFLTQIYQRVWYAHSSPTSNQEIGRNTAIVV